MKFEEGTKVKTVQHCTIMTGHILKAYDDMNLAVVKFENGEVGKVHYDKLIICENDVQPEKENRDGTITIEKEDFKNQIVRLISNEEELYIRLCSTLLVKELVRNIFGEADAVTISVNDLFTKIADVTNPMSMIKGANMTDVKLLIALCLDIALVFDGLSSHYFNEEYDHD